MPIATHRTRYLFIALVLSWLALILLTRPAHGGWSADPVQVHATSALCPVVAACDDGHYGAVVVWQENTASGGLLKAQHLLASGDLDPAWAAPAAVSSTDVARTAAGAVSDGAGGAYVWWMQSSMLYLTHVGAAGSVSAGWPAGGRALGALPSTQHRPDAAADGAGGVYVGWLSMPLFGDPIASVRVVHLGASNTGAGGWATGGRSFGLAGADALTAVSFGLDAAPGGGLWLAWQLQNVEGATQPGDVRVLRVTEAGLPASGWTAEGVSIAPYDPAFLSQSYGWSSPPAAGQIAIANDGGSGAFIVNSQGAAEGGYADHFTNTLYRVDAVGGTAAGWSPAGVDLGIVGVLGLPDLGDRASVRALTDDRGGVYAGLPWYASEFTERIQFYRRAGDGSTLPGGIGADQRGIEFAARGDGGMFIASYKPSGATGPYEANAYVAAGQSDPGASFYESEPSYYSTRYGDIGLAPTGDGGAIVAWSELIDRQGVFAVRLGPGGVVTGVPPTVLGAPTLRVRFVRGEGVRAWATMAGPVWLSLHDLAGRRISTTTTVNDDRIAMAQVDVLFPGTRDLPGGVYFVRAVGGAHEVHARVIVLH